MVFGGVGRCRQLTGTIKFRRRLKKILASFDVSLSLATVFGFVKTQLADLPVTDNAINWCRHSWHHFKFNEQRKMVGEYVRMWATDDFILRQPLGRDRSQQTQWCHCLFRVKNIIDNALKIESETSKIFREPLAAFANLRVICERHYLIIVGRSELEGMCKFIRFITAQDLLQALFITKVFEILVVLRHPPRAQELNHARVGQRVEIATKNQLDAVRVCVHVLRRSQRLSGLVEYALELVAQHHRLDQFHVAKLGIPVDMCRAYEDRLLDERRVGGSCNKRRLTNETTSRKIPTVFPRRFRRLQKRCQADVVLRHHSVEHVVQAVRVRHRQLIKLD
ncbi:hypothetical protein TcasGA2_TC001168 [Tribolium castaneum]|uniref:Uncharacterized protein n=1 Tax=Tribolium castaneum TaxID=7070 RepID=D6WAJ4_TRICA|nr:hypothetical protein TcasGA2_TC001168 [Tribolium castaneum]